MKNLIKFKNVLKNQPDIKILKDKPRKQYPMKFRNYEFKASDEVLQQKLQTLANLNFYPDYIRQLRRIFPKIFEEKQNLPNFTYDLEEWVTASSSHLNLKEIEQRSILYRFPQVIQYSMDFVDERKLLLQKLFLIEPEIAQELLINAPLGFFQSEENLRNFRKIFEMFFDFDENKIKTFFNNNIDILIGDPQRVLKNLEFLTNKGFEGKQIYDILSVYKYFLFRNHKNLFFIFQFLEHKNIKPQQIKHAIIINPFILSMDYQDNLIALMHFFTDQNISQQLFCQYFVKYPWLCTKSINSLKTKQNFIERQLLQTDLVNQKHFPKILQYPFNTFIQPRGLLMKKYKELEWSEVFKLKDDEFCKKINCELSELEDLKKPHEKEIDIKIHKFLKNISKNKRDKIFEHPMIQLKFQQ